LEFNVPFQHKYGYIRDEAKPGTNTERKQQKTALAESITTVRL